MSYEKLRAAAYNIYSQSGEDGVLQFIFSVIRPANEWCLECGAADGLFFSNTRRLVEQGWRGIFIEKDEEMYRRLVKNCEGFGPRVTCARASVGETVTLDAALTQLGAPADIDLVSIDVDGQDYYMLNSLLVHRPRVVVVEYDPGADDDHIPPWRGSGQAGLGAMRKLAAGKFYTEVFRSFSNLVLVRQPDDRLLDDEAIKRAAA